MYQLTVSAPTAEDLRAQIINLAEQLNHKPAPVVVEETKAVSTDTATVSSSADPVVETTETNETKEVTLEDIRAMLNTLREKKGIGTVKEILAKLGVAKLTELKPEQFAEAQTLAEQAV